MAKFIRLHSKGREVFINMDKILSVTEDMSQDEVYGGTTIVSFDDGDYIRPDEPVEDVMDLIAFKNKEGN